tara:strand:+ start:18036 stop:18728 length:693 start_codon:yes stop_codon:yes gene_type:complete
MKKFIRFVFYFSVSLFLGFIIYLCYLRPYHLEYEVKSSDRYQTKLNKIQNENLYNCSLILLGDSRFTKVKCDFLKEINLSIGGETSKTMYERCKKYKFRDSIKVVLCIGLNDVLFSYKYKAIIKNMKLLINQLLSKTYFSNFYICKILPINSSGFFYKKNEVNYTINKINSFLDSISFNRSNNKIDIIEFNEFININDELDMKYSDDGIHINQNGIGIFNKYLRQKLKNE